MASWLDRLAPADWNQAVMDLGRIVCRPAPRCGECPLAADCGFRRSRARPRSPGRRQAPFEGSDRQVRGAIVRALRVGRSLDAPGIAGVTGHEVARIERLVPGLARDGLLERAASGRIRLPRR
jgi:A/G-specific adenine glycosylase